MCITLALSWWPRPLGELCRFVVKTRAVVPLFDVFSVDCDVVPTSIPTFNQNAAGIESVQLQKNMVGGRATTPF